MANRSIPRSKSSICSKNNLVGLCGAIVGLLIGSWLSIWFVVNTSTHSDIQPSVPSFSLRDSSWIKHPSFSYYSIQDEVERLQWTRNRPFLEWASESNSPLIVPSLAIDSWNLLFNWASMDSWITGNSAKYNIQTTTHSVLYEYDHTKPLDGEVPIPSHLIPSTSSSTISHFLDNVYDTDSTTKSSDTQPKIQPNPSHAQFHGYCYDAEKQISELPNLPFGPLQFQSGEFKNCSLELYIYTKGLVKQPKWELDAKIIMQVTGASTWMLSPPNQLAKFNPFPFFHPLHAQSQLDFSKYMNDANLTSFIEIDDTLLNGHHEAHDAIRAEPILGTIITLQPGDILFVPASYVHQFYVESTSTTIEVSLEKLEKSQENKMRSILASLKSVVLSGLHVDASDDEDPDDPITILKRKLNIFIDFLRYLDAIEDKNVITLYKQQLFDSYKSTFDQIIAEKHHHPVTAIREVCYTYGNSSPDDQRVDKRMSDMAELVHAHLDSFESAYQKANWLALFIERALFEVISDEMLIFPFVQECI